LYNLIIAFSKTQFDVALTFENPLFISTTGSVINIFTYFDEGS